MKYFTTIEILCVLDDRSVAAIDFSKVSEFRDIFTATSPLSLTPLVQMKLKRHSRDIRYKAPPLLVCAEKIGEPGNEATSNVPIALRTRDGTHVL